MYKLLPDLSWLLGSLGMQSEYELQKECFYFCVEADE